MSEWHKYFLSIAGALLVSFSSGTLLPQAVPHPVADYGIYDFLDELAGEDILSLHSAVKPYTRAEIARLLDEAEAKRDRLNARQAEELDFYRRDFGRETSSSAVSGKRFDLFSYKDSLFSFTVNPVLGAEVLRNGSGTATYWRNGIEARAYVAGWGFYASMVDNHEKPLLGKPEYLTSRAGGHIKNSTDWSEMQGGVTYSWKWGYAGLVKERFTWGTNYHGANILGGNTPSFAHLRLHLEPVKWFTFNYFHGWLNSMVVDSTRSYWISNSYGTVYRDVYHRKFMAANLITITPVRNLDLSAGNSIVYSDLGLFPAYLIPVLFYKSVDHSVNSGINNMNSQMFFDLSSRQIKHFHLYATLFVDELSVNRIFRKDEWNFFSWKGGVRTTGLPVENMFMTVEYTFNYPLTFRHFVPTLTYESNNYNLGHYLKDNSREWFLNIGYRPFRGFSAELWFEDAVRGPDYQEAGGSRIGNPPLASVEWHSTVAGLTIRYQAINDLYLWLGLTTGKVTGDARWSAPYFSGKKNTLNAGVTFGF